MNGEEDFHVENTVETERSLGDICVLLLDSDDTCLVNLSEMMRKCGFRVVATTSADDVPLIINNKDEKIDLVLAEFHFIEMNKYEVLEKISSICEIPIVVMGAYVKYTIFDCLRRGADYCMKKPLVESDLENLWQFIVRKRQFIVRKQRDFHSQIDTNPSEKKYSITQTQSLRDELNRTSKDKEVKTEELDEYKDKLPQGKKRKERTNTYTGEHTEKDHGCDLGDEKKPKLICADDLQSGTLEAIPNIEEANNERKEPTESEKEKPELVCMEEELEKWSTQPVTNFDAFVEYKFEERDFQPLESVGECVGYYGEIPLSPQESSNKCIAGQLLMQKTQRSLDEEVMQDGISLADLEFDLQEGQGSTSDLEKKANQELFDEIFTDLAKELEP